MIAIYILLFGMFLTALYVIGALIVHRKEVRNDKRLKGSADGVLKALRKDKMLSHEPNSEVDVHPKYWQSFKNLNNVN